MTDKLRAAAQAALETLEDVFGKDKIDVSAINNLRAALAEPTIKESLTVAEPEPVAWLVTYGGLTHVKYKPTQVVDTHYQPLYTASPRRKFVSKIDGSEETRGEDSLISGFIAEIDALPSEKGAIGLEPRGCPTPGACSAVDELIDLKQRLLPQFAGRAERAEKAKRMAEHERDALLEQLLVAEKRVADQMTNGVATWAQAWKEKK